MTESEFFERFDAHLAEISEEVRLSREEIRLSREQHTDLREFSRDLTRRSEIVLTELVGNIGEMRTDLRELNDQARAHTAALLSVLDRLN